MPGNAGNARDNRQRGNAAQLLEKYKSLARDAQLAGDRVQTEYYLQYADHYFRVLEDSRSRFEEQQAQRRPRREDDEDEVEGNEEMAAESEDGDEDASRRLTSAEGPDDGGLGLLPALVGALVVAAILTAAVAALRNRRKDLTP